MDFFKKQETRARRSGEERDAPAAGAVSCVARSVASVTGKLPAERVTSTVGVAVAVVAARFDQGDPSRRRRLPNFQPSTWSPAAGPPARRWRPPGRVAGDSGSAAALRQRSQRWSQPVSCGRFHGGAQLVRGQHKHHVTMSAPAATRTSLQPATAAATAAVEALLHFPLREPTVGAIPRLNKTGRDDSSIETLRWVVALMLQASSPSCPI